MAAHVVAAINGVTRLLYIKLEIAAWQQRQQKKNGEEGET